MLEPEATAAQATWTLVGIDCATQEDRLGLARGTLSAAGTLVVERVTLGTAGESAAASVAQWIKGKTHFVLAMDAPLGWPSALGDALRTHTAGALLSPSPEVLFRRDTDRVVQKALGKWPVEVAADRMAHTARAALAMLNEIRQISGLSLPLAWQQGRESGAIEVYPTATLLTRGWPATGYKGQNASSRKARADLLKRLSTEMDIQVAHDVMTEDPDLLDAVVCVLAGADFARGLCVEPAETELSRKEGFIWFRSSGQRSLSY